MRRTDKAAIGLSVLTAVFVLAANVSPNAEAQSGSQNTFGGNAPLQGSSTTRGSSTTQGSAMKGSAMKESTTQGSAVKGSTTQGSATKGSAMKGSTTQGSATQGSVTRGSATQGSSAVTIVQSYDQRLWKYLKASRYENWAPVPGKTGAAYAGESPHGAFLKMYLNRRAVGNPKTLPEGSLIIKENYGPDGKTLMAITAMVKAKGYNPSGGDWYWVKFRPNGTVDQKIMPTGTAVTLSGKPKGCIECHSGADGGDFLFFNDSL